MKIEDAIAIALEAHRGQRDKGGQPYILHPLRLMLAAGSDDERVVAVLHDVVEDSRMTLADLKARGLSPVQAAGLEAVTRRDGESYEDFVIRAGDDPVGRAVKILDLRDNSDLSRIPNPSEKDLSRVDKYRRALKQLGC